VSIVRQLIAAKAPCDLTNNMGCTPLMQACMTGTVNHMIPVLVEEAKVQIDQRNPSEIDQGGITFKGATAMHMVSAHALSMSACVPHRLIDIATHGMVGLHI
jgi:ankyrin repeat protein